MANVPECTRCGACCFSQLETYVRVTGDDYERLGEAAPSVSHFVGNRCYMHMHDGHCAQLSIAASGEFWCGLYERRPDVCRTLERGSAACEAERERKSDAALVAAARLLRRAR